MTHLNKKINKILEKSRKTTTHWLKNQSKYLLCVSVLSVPVCSYANDVTEDITKIVTDKKGASETVNIVDVIGERSEITETQITKQKSTANKPKKVQTSQKTTTNLNHIIQSINQQHNSASYLVKSARPPIKLSLNSSLLNESALTLTHKEIHKDDILQHLTAVASTSISNFRQTGNAIITSNIFTSNDDKTQTQLTASHKSLPIGTKIKVTNKNNGKSVIVKISKKLSANNKNRILSLSNTAASQIGMLNKGIGKVIIEKIR